MRVVLQTPRMKKNCRATIVSESNDSVDSSKKYKKQQKEKQESKDKPHQLAQCYRGLSRVFDFGNVPARRGEMRKG